MQTKSYGTSSDACHSFKQTRWIFSLGMSSFRNTSVMLYLQSQIFYTTFWSPKHSYDIKKISRWKGTLKLWKMLYLFLSYINVLSIFQGIFSGCLNRSLARKVSSMPMVRKEGREDSWWTEVLVMKLSRTTMITLSRFHTIFALFAFCSTSPDSFF